VPLAWVTLAAAIAGAAIALIGQQITKRGETRFRILELLLEQCTQLDALNTDYWTGCGRRKSWA
jgi:hypothetical protein